MNRLLPTAVAGFAVLFVGFRALSLESDAANAAAPNSSALNATDAGFSALGQAAGIGLPMGALVGGLALILAVGLVVGR